MGIVGASLRSPDTRDALAPQDCLYSVAVRSGAGTDHRIIGSVLGCEVATENPGQLIARLTNPATRIVSLTVTEKGYCHTPQTGDLDERHPDIVLDLPEFRRAALGNRIPRCRASAPTGLQARPPSPFCPATISRPMAIPSGGS